MPQNRFLAALTLDVGMQVMLSKDDTHYLRKVLRNTTGDEIELINGKGFLAKAIVEKTTNEGCSARITSVVKANPEPFHITLALGFLKPNHLEYALEKATEVGASRFFLFKGDRSEKKELSDTYYKRLCTIVEAATKQCGRLYLPEIIIKKDLQGCLEETATLFYGDFGPHTIDIRDAQRTLHARCTIVIGPESGLSDKEKELLQKRSALPLSLHPNTLRAETAAASAVLLLYTTLSKLFLTIP